MGALVVWLGLGMAVYLFYGRSGAEALRAGRAQSNEHSAVERKCLPLAPECADLEALQGDLETHTVPFQYSVDHRRQRIRAVGSGAVSVTDLVSYVAARVKDGIYDYDQLLDLSDAQLDVASYEVIQVVKQARVHLSRKPIPFTAIVARIGTATFGLTRQLATLFDFEGASVHVFDSVDAANAWLDKMSAERREGRAASEENR